MTSAASSTVHSDLSDQWCASFNAALRDENYERVAALFAEDGYWRDILTFDDRIQTAQGPAAIRRMLGARRDGGATLRLSLVGEARVETLPGVGEVAGRFLRYETNDVIGRGYLRLTSDLRRAFTLLTSVQELRGVRERSLKHRDGETHRSGPGAVANWLDRRVAEQAYTDRDPQVLVIGAGHAGLTVAARLRHLDVDTLVVERAERVGDNWRNRYHSLTLHNEICCNHLPYLPFPDSWPLYLPKDKLAGWLEFYAEAMELNVWTRTSFLGGDYDDGAKRWNVRLQRVDGRIRTMRPSHIVMAIGVSGLPNIPRFAGQDRFKGEIIHSSRFGRTVNVASKSVVVVGAGTSAHDIAQDVVLRGGRPVLVQRSPVTVVSVERAALAYAAFRRNEGGLPIEDTDLMVASMPYDLARRVHGPLSKIMAKGDEALLRGLSDVGFLLDNGEDDTGFFMKLVRYLGGYYLNVGASDLIIEGKIGLKSGVEVRRLDEYAVELSDGTVLEADLIVLGTGYRPMHDAVAAMFGPEVARRVGPIWGLGPDGELRNMWMRTGQPGLFVSGGTFTMARFYSKVTALLIKADLAGITRHKRTAAIDATQAIA
jgi:cation diffusion facilitator CzcD-associated flavoprotein CzcO